MAIFTAITTFAATAGAWLAAASGLSLAAATAISTAVINTAISVGLSLVQRLLQPSVSVPRAEVQAVISQTDAPRRVYVGQYLAGGIRAFFDVKDSSLYQLVMVAHGPITEFSEFWVDGVPVSLDGGGDVDEGKMVGYLHCDTRDGSSLGGDYGDLISNFSIWTTDHKLTGQATFLALMKAPGGNDFSKIFPKAYNTSLQWVIKGQAIYDPRTDSSAYSDNAALVIGHYLTHADGYKLADAEVNWDSVDAMADASDEAVDQLEGGTAASLRLWGYWTLDEGPTDVMSRMHSSCGIRPYEMQDGRVGLIGGPFGETACTLTAKDISQIRTSEATSEREGYNVLRVSHLDASQNYEVVEVDSWRDETRLAVEGEIVQEYILDMCPSRSQARRLAKQQIHDDNRAKVIVVTNLVGLKARFPKEDGQRHTILLDYQPEDGSGRVIHGEYEVLNHDFDPVNLECQIELAKVDRASEAWTVSEEGDPPTALPVEESSLAPEISATLTQTTLTVTERVRQATLTVTAVAVAGRDDLEIEAQYRITGETRWEKMTANEFIAQSGAVEDGTEYEARVRFVGVFDEPDEWEDLDPITIQVDAVAPGAPTDIIPSNSGGGVNLTWRNPSSAFSEARVYRHSSASFGSATLIGTTGGVSGQISEYTDSTVAAATEYFYWVTAANVSGVESAPVGPANITTP
ncbi:phage tail protein [Roseovarius aestuarii]|nr:phage tail protein [Roseovarius aestuarii]